MFLRLAGEGGTGCLATTCSTHGPGEMSRASLFLSRTSCTSALCQVPYIDVMFQLVFPLYDAAHIVVMASLGKGLAAIVFMPW